MQVRIRETLVPLPNDLFSFCQLKGGEWLNSKRLLKWWKKEASVSFHNADGSQTRSKSHAARVARAKSSARTWTLLRLTPPTNGFQEFTSPLHHLGQTLKFLAEPWNSGKREEKKATMNLCLAPACVSVCAQQLTATKQNHFSRGSPEIYRFRRARCGIRHKVQSNGTAFFLRRWNHEYLTARPTQRVKCLPATPL